MKALCWFGKHDVRVENVAVLFVNVPYCLDGLFVADADGRDIFLDLLELPTEKFENANEIAGVTDIHRVRERCDGRLWSVITGFQKLRDGGIRVAAAALFHAGDRAG